MDKKQLPSEVEEKKKPEELELMDEYIDDYGYFYDNPAEEYERNKKLKIGLTIRNVAIGLLAFVIGVTCLGFFLRTMKYGARIVTQETISETQFWDNTDKAVEKADELMTVYANYKGDSAVQRATAFKHLYEETYPYFTYMESVANSKYAPKMKVDGWENGTPALFRDSLYQLYISYTMPILDTFNNQVTERNPGWTEEVATSLLEPKDSESQSDYFVQIKGIKELQNQAKQSCNIV